jgi:hypothetical protein
MGKAGDVPAVGMAGLVRRQSCRDKPYGIKPKGLPDMISHCQVPVVDRIESAAQQADVLLYFRCLHHDHVDELIFTACNYVLT